jgi:hypothetical protein
MRAFASKYLRVHYKDSSLRKHYRKVDSENREIRLLELESGSGCSRLRCRLKHVFLTNERCPQHGTISWGDKTQHDNIDLDGRTFDVTQNAEAALQCMRLVDKRRTVWVDAICIDQSNTSGEVNKSR